MLLSLPADALHVVARRMRVGDAVRFARACRAARAAVLRRLHAAEAVLLTVPSLRVEQLDRS